MLEVEGLSAGYPDAGEFMLVDGLHADHGGAAASLKRADHLCDAR